MTRSRAVYKHHVGRDENPTSVIEAAAEPDANRAPVASGDTGRDKAGRYLPGNSIVRARFDLDAVLRKAVGPWQMATDLLDLCHNREYAPETRLKAIQYTMDRISGRPRQAITVSADDSAGVIAMRQLYAAISGTTYEPPAEVDATYEVLPAAAPDASSEPHI